MTRLLNIMFSFCSIILCKFIRQLVQKCCHRILIRVVIKNTYLFSEEGSDCKNKNQILVVTGCRSLPDIRTCFEGRSMILAGSSTLKDPDLDNKPLAPGDKNDIIITLTVIVRRQLTLVYSPRYFF